MNGFYVHASNIHTDESKRYGPFPGNPGMTYNFLRCDGDAAPDDDHIFAYEDPSEWQGSPDDDHWIDQQGRDRYDGWRRCYYQPRGDGYGQFGMPHGPFWTDLWIEELPNPQNIAPGDIPWESNVLPNDTPERPVPMTTRGAWT